MQLRTEADLRSVYREPKGGPVDKVIDRLDEHCRVFLECCPFVVLSTASAEGVCDGSPKGGAPGFVRMLDEHRVALPDLSGNNRLDSFTNLVGNPSVSVLCLIPGTDETLRINGKGELRSDPDLCAEIDVDGRPAKVVLVVHVDEAYLHCGKAFRRSALWQPDTWPTDDERPDIRCALRDHVNAPVTAEQLGEALEADYQATLWRPGGES